MVCFEVGLGQNATFEYMIGNGAFVGSFFDTVTVLLENGKRGSSYPVFCRFYNGVSLIGPEITALRKEVEDIQNRLKSFPPSKVVWDMENPDSKPPWGDNISPEITDLSNYFVTAYGNQLFRELYSAIDHAIRVNTYIKIFSTFEPTGNVRITLD